MGELPDTTRIATVYTTVVVLENGELRQYDFPDAIQTEIYGISDATGALTGNFIDASGVRRGFTGEEIIEFPGALETYANFVSAGRLVGSYVDAEGLFHLYLRTPDGRFSSIDVPGEYEYFFMPSINDAGVQVARFKAVGGYTAHIRRHTPRARGITVSGQRDHGGLEYQSGQLCRRIL